MKIEGNLATYEFSDLLQWLAQGNKSGVLTVGDGGVEYQLGFDHGRIDMSSSSDPAHHLDSYLFSQGLIDEATLARAERLREATQMMSGQVLVTLGAVTDGQLAQALRDKTETILCELLGWEQGTFVFEGGDRLKSTSTMVPISLEVTKLLLECMHCLDQRQRGDQPQPAAVLVQEPSLPADATQAIDGLALAEVLNPETAAEPQAEPVAEELDDPGAQLLPHYAVMTQSPGPIQRMAPLALVLLLSLVTGGFYLANIEASASAVDEMPAGEPILFTQTAGPSLPRATVPSETPAVVGDSLPRADDSEVEEALRRRYEQELTDLRKELEEARRLSQPVTQDALAGVAKSDSVTAQDVMAEVPADAIIRAAIARPAAPPHPAAVVAEGTPADAASTSPEADTMPVPTVEKLPPPEPPVVIPAETSMANLPAEGGRSLRFAKPSLLSRPAPSYPQAARRLKRGATVTVRVLVGVDGRVTEVERVGPKIGMGFDRAAEHAALDSVWKPGSRSGEPISMWADLRFEFQP